MGVAEVDELQRRASALFRAGRVIEGISAYEALLARDPARPDSWFNLAMLYRGAHRIDHAIAAYGRALEFGISGPEEVHLQLGVIHAEDRRAPQDARRAYETALALNPRYLPALINLGNVAEDVGDRVGARAAYERALALDPAHALALSRLAGLGDMSPEQGAALAVRIEAQLSRPDLPVVDRADLGFALGALRDRRGEHDAAFAAFSQANEAGREAYVVPRYDRQAQAALVDRLIAAFPASVASDVDDGDAAHAPIFICGMFRSGSTLVERILSRHPQVTAGGEIDLIPTMAARLQPWPEAAARASDSDIAALRALYLRETGRLHPVGSRLTDKRPDNLFHVGLIKRLFPAARIVFTRRNPLDNCLSVYFLQAGPALPYATDLGDIAHHYRQQERLMAHWTQLYPDDIMTIDYDALVAAPRPTMERLVAFCGLAWDEAVLNPHVGADTVRTPSHWQVREPLHGRASGRWRAYERHIGTLLSAFETAKGGPEQATETGSQTK